VALVVDPGRILDGKASYCSTTIASGGVGKNASKAIDNLNTRYAGTVVSLGQWRPPPGGHVGGKIS
jgi:hypothetical protein